MDIHFIEATSQGFNWGKFMVARFTEAEWAVRSALDSSHLLAGRGWSHDHLLVLDLATGEGALFAAKLSANAKHDLNKHRVWVCPLFEPFLQWLYEQKTAEMAALSALPKIVDLPNAQTALQGYRRSGPEVGHPVHLDPADKQMQAMATAIAGGPIDESSGIKRTTYDNDAIAFVRPKKDDKS